MSLNFDRNQFSLHSNPLTEDMDPLVSVLCSITKYLTKHITGMSQWLTENRVVEDRQSSC